MNNRHASSHPVPSFWIGAWKHWEHLCTSFGEALVSINEDGSLYAIGGSGGGKTTACQHVQASKILQGRSIVTIDPKGDGALGTLELAARAGVDPSQILYINLREQDQPVGYSPFSGQSDTYQKVLAFEEAIASEYDGLGPQTSEYLRNTATAIVEAGGTLLDFELIFYSETRRNAILAKVSSESLRLFWQRFDSLSSDKQSQLASPVINKVAPLLATKGLRRMFGHPEPVDIGKHLRTPGSVTIISLATDATMGAGWKVGRLLLSTISREIFSQVNTPESQRNPLVLFLDEFQHLQEREIEAILTEGRKFRCTCVMAHQTLAQLSPKFRSIILSNASVKLAFRTSYADAEVLSKDLGIRGLFDLTKLPVGEAILWQKGDNPWPVEISAPLIRDGARLSPLGKELEARIDELKPAFFELVEDEPEEEAPNVESDDTTNARTSKPKSPGRPPSNLEDWLQ